jgi:hypothetical protein
VIFGGSDGAVDETIESSERSPVRSLGKFGLMIPLSSTFLFVLSTSESIGEGKNNCYLDR